MENILYKTLFIIFAIFFVLFLYKANSNMQRIPFHDFDEAHRAEKAKRMKEYFSFLMPLSGSPQDRTYDLRVPLRENNNLFLYYHPERPPLVYWLMMVSTSIFGQGEWAYRLPSLLMALLTMGIFPLFIYFSSKKIHLIPLCIGLVSLLTSYDLWLSGQYAQLDTSLTFFLTLSLFSLILYIEKKRITLLLISGISLALAILSKGQPAVIFSFPIVALLIIKKLSKKELIKFFLYAGIIIFPWLFFLGIYFDLPKFISIFTHFAAYSAAFEYSNIKAPIFWYIRWWWDSLRPGWTLFLALLAIDFLYKNFYWKKLILLSYIIGGLVLFSISVNKIWWYTLPLIPAIAYYIYLSSHDYLEKTKFGLGNISFVIFIASIPGFLTETNTFTLLYGIFITGFSIVVLLMQDLKFLYRYQKILLIFAVLLSLLSFYSHFPKIIPYHRNTKFVAEFYKFLPGKKCLWVADMPPETALFYSNAGEILPLTENANLFPDCENYLITPGDIKNDDLSYSLFGKTLKLKKQKIVFQKGTMKLVKL